MNVHGGGAGVRRSAASGLGVVLAVIVFAMGGCSLDVAPPNDETRETLRELDTYRASEPEHRTISGTFSDNPYYPAVDDQPTSAAMQFPGGRICRLRLADVLLTTLKNNRAIRVDDYTRAIAAEGVTASKGIYDLLIQASYAHQSVNGQLPERLRPGQGDPLDTRTRSDAMSLTLSQLVPSGGQLQLNLQRNSLSGAGTDAASIDPAIGLSTGLSFVQPLLQGFGPTVTNAPIRIAQMKQDVAVETFRQTVITQLVKAVDTYWDLVFAIDNYEVQRVSLARARELLRVSTIQVDTGVQPPNVVLQAQAEVATREALVIDGARAIANAADALKRVMNIREGSEEWNFNLLPVERPSYTPVNVSETAVYQEALAMRPDYRSAQLGEKIANLNKRVADNGRLPQLNAFGGVSVTGLDDSNSGAFDEASDGDHHAWNAGLTFSYPLQNRRAQGNYRASVLTEQQIQEQIAALAQQIGLETRLAVRSIETSQKLIHAWEVAVVSQKAKLDSQIKRFEVGLATIFEVLVFQEDLANAQVNYIKAVVDYNKALIELQRVKASFLSDYRIEFLDKVVAEREQTAVSSPVPAPSVAAVQTLPELPEEPK